MRRMLMAVAAVVSLTGCNLDVPAPTGASTKPSDPTTETFAPELLVDISTMKKTAAGTYYKDLKAGSGTTLQGVTAIVWSYQGFLKNGARFGLGVQQTINMNQLVGGLRDAMVGMQVGGERLIVIPSELGFGPLGTTGVPPNSTLVYDVVLDQIL